eukprot:CAMPEP_0184985228 /NCGR_PEP_ID=MMETSP1098-20130426/14003_1 /TAXON_ID=89044 /ORGANISM="Spumella elongata, Strain CCAP 955/1" /LENGTH=1061 /DNA_ID=CAMNT_0027509305 /DNA_START=44 /DNA_END=3229 /DNA_ORIENTATION=+
MLHALKRSVGYSLARKANTKSVAGNLSRLLSSKAPGFDFMSGEHKASICSGLTFSTGLIGHLSESSVMCSAGGSVVHAVVNSARAENPESAFLPLTVDYRSRQYAFGQFPATLSRREKHGSDDEILVSRCIDRAVRPLFPKGYVDEVQLLVTAHAADGVHDPTIAAVNAASFALMCSEQPWYGPIGCVRIGLIDGELRVDPSVADMERSTLDFVYAGTEGRALMVEAIGQQIPENIIVQASKLADSAVTEIINTQRNLVKQMQAKKLAQLTGADSTTDVTTAAKKGFFSVPQAFADAVDALGYNEAVQVYSTGVADKVARGRAEGQLRNQVIEAVKSHPEWGTQPVIVQAMAVDSMMHKAFRAVLLDGPASSSSNTTARAVANKEVRRSDGRSTNEVRPISSAVEVLPSVHGSSYFARGDTHVLSTVTLGSLENAKAYIPLDGSGEEKKHTFMLHYDFPPYSTGEMGNATATNRRMIGHGNLAEKGLRPVLPSIEDFPYAVRVFCECTASNGSSSMASACGGTLALLDAGVPLKAHVAAVSVGLVTGEEVAMTFGESAETGSGNSNGRYTVLRDITGSEDYNGDMDYKIAGTEQGITAIQLDVKLPGGVPLHMLDTALESAKEGRLHILHRMQTTLSAARESVKPQAPKAEMVKYDVDRKGMLIGPRGEMKTYMEELFNVTIDLDTTEGAAYIFGKDGAAVAACAKLVQDIAVLVKEGDTVTATIQAVLDYGAVVTINRAQQALLHATELTHDKDLFRKSPSEMIKVGQRFNVKITQVDKATGFIKVSRKALLDANTSVPDLIRPLAPATHSGFAQDPDTVPTFAQNEPGLPLKITAADFPTSPVRPYTKDYFSKHVVPDKDVKAAVDRQNQLQQTVVAPTAKASFPDGRTAAHSPRTPSHAVSAEGTSTRNSAQNNHRPSPNSSKGSTAGPNNSRPTLQQQSEQRPASSHVPKKHAPRAATVPSTAPGFVIDEALREVVNPTQPLRVHDVADLLDGASLTSVVTPLDSPSAVQYGMDSNEEKKVDLKQRFDNNAKNRKTKRDRNNKASQDQTQVEGVSDV